MRDNIRSKQQPFQLSLGVKQASAALVAALLVVGAAFALGLGVGRKSSAAPAPSAGAPGDALSRLDEPIAAREEPPLELKAHQALTEKGSIDKTMPVPTVTSVAKAAAPPPSGRTEEKGAAEQDPVVPPPIAAPGPAPLPATASSSPLSLPPQPGSTSLKPPTSPATLTSTSTKASTRATTKTATKATQPPRTVALKSRSKGKGAYTIQIAAAHNRADAERVAKRVAARRPRIVAADVPGKGRWYRVQIGSYETRESARLALLSMSGVHGVVTPAR